MSVDPRRTPVELGETEIADFEHSLAVHKQVVGLEVEKLSFAAC
jgi:hypothetical protein